MGPALNSQVGGANPEYANERRGQPRVCQGGGGPNLNMLMRRWGNLSANKKARPALCPHEEAEPI